MIRVGGEGSNATEHDGRVLDRVRRIVLQALGPRPVRVYLFGSWASGTQRRSSDIDVAIHAGEPLPPGMLAGLREALEESNIPYRVEIVDLAEADSAFCENVRREGVLWSGCGSD